MPARQAFSTAWVSGSSLVVLHAVGAVGQVQHPDRVLRVVVAVRHDPVDRGDDLRDVDGALRCRHLDAGQPGTGRDALELPAREQRRRVVAGDDAGHVRAVTERVQVPLRFRLALERQVRAVDDVAVGQPAHRHHAGVDQSDSDALARDSPAVHPVGADDRGDVVQVGDALVGDPAGRAEQALRRAGDQRGDATDQATHRAEQAAEQPGLRGCRAAGAQGQGQDRGGGDRRDGPGGAAPTRHRIPLMDVRPRAGRRLLL